MPGLTAAMRSAAMVAVFSISSGGGAMTISNAGVTEADRLFDILNGKEVRPSALDSAINTFSDAAKNAVVTRVAVTFEPPPHGALLSRLLLIMTGSNKVEMAAAFMENLRSPDPEARQASLRGLEKLEHPALVDFALLSLRDNSDTVVAAACQILVARAQRDPIIRKFLQSAYRSRMGRREFYLSNSVLEASGIASETSSPQ